MMWPLEYQSSRSSRDAVPLLDERRGVEREDSELLPGGCKGIHSGLQAQHARQIQLFIIDKKISFFG